jgi:hypothetical protein
VVTHPWQAIQQPSTIQKIRWALILERLTVSLVKLDLSPLGVSSTGCITGRDASATILDITAKCF